jgi:hypothetical protein
MIFDSDGGSFNHVWFDGNRLLFGGNALLF